MASSKRVDSVEPQPPAPSLRPECVLDESAGVVRVTYLSEADYAKNVSADQASIEALTSWKIVRATLGPTSSSGRAPWPLIGEWFLAPSNRN